MSLRPSSPHRLPGRAPRPSYTWQRGGPNFKGIVGLFVILAAVMLIGSSIPGSQQAAGEAAVWSGQRTDAGLVLYELTAEHNMLNTGRITAEAAGGGWYIEPGTFAQHVRLAPMHGFGGDRPMLQLTPTDGQTLRASQSAAVRGSEALTVAFSAHALSTMGDARVTFTLYDNRDRALATLGWLLVGSSPATSANEQWFDVRRRANFEGAEAGGIVDVHSWLQHRFAIDPAAVNRVEVKAVASDGQHLVIETAYVGTMDAAQLQQQIAVLSSPDEPALDTPLHYVSLADSVKVNNAADAEINTTPPAPGPVNVVAPSETLTMGDTFTVTATVRPDVTPRPLTITLNAPTGYGLLVDDPVQQVSMAGAEHASLQWTVTAQRPHAANFNRPWQLTFTVTDADGDTTYPGPTVNVVDPRPGQVFYVLTDDLEPMDSAGYPTRFTGNRNGWLDPQEFQVQLINKSEAMNRIAEKHGARWSHFIAWPAVIGAQWAAEQSDTGAWPAVIADLEASVQQGALAGHQYTPHLHIDYDWRLEGSVIAYDEATDGYWANHRAHGWTHQLPRLGSFADINSRTGTLYDYMARFERLLRSHGQGQQLATRTGSFDFGTSAVDQIISTEAFRRVGLWASSDAGGNAGGMTSADFGNNMYWTRPDDLTLRSGDLQHNGIVQFLPTPRRFIAHESETVASSNAKIDEAMQAYTAGGTPAPGVHSIVSFTHAMFLLGDGDWTSTTGGAFAVLDDHLAYVTETYVKSGQLQYGTANELTAAWLDYYTPELIAVRGPESFDPDEGVFTYPITLLGKDIPLGEPHEHTVAVKYPLYFTDDMEWARIYRDDTLVASFTDFPTPYNDLPFTVTAPGNYRLVIAPPQPPVTDHIDTEHEANATGNSEAVPEEPGPTADDDHNAT